MPHHRHGMCVEHQTTLKPEGEASCCSATQPFRLGHPPIADLKVSRRKVVRAQRNQLDFIREMNRRHSERFSDESELNARIESFELAYRMQMTAPDALDLSGESAATQRLYGMDNPRCDSFARQALTARRLIERGTRFVQLYSGGFANENCWDGHVNIDGNHRQFAGETDQPIAGLLTDLKQRGLLDSTMVVWGGEFGRTPLGENRTARSGVTGRDHHPHSFTMLLSGGGLKGGLIHGDSDDVGWGIAEDPVHINDLHATMLHQFGLDHLKLTHRFLGRDFRLTDVGGKVIPEWIA